MTDKWKAASIEQRRPCWHIFTEVNIQYICDQVAINNPTWFPDLYATNLTLYLNGVHANKLWWLHSVLQSSRVWEDTVHESSNANGVCSFNCRVLLNKAFVQSGHARA
jgi:hypothetical protein